MKNEVYPPIGLINKAVSKYPDAWEIIEGMRRKKGKGLPDWNNRCYIPMGATHAIVTHEAKNEQDLQDMLFSGGVNWMSILAALAAWRKSKEAYKFDKSLEKMLYDQTNVDWNIPSSVFLNLPYNCVYIEYPQLELDCHGFFVFFEHDTYKKHLELRNLYNYLLTKKYKNTSKS